MFWYAESRKKTQFCLPRPDKWKLKRCVRCSNDAQRSILYILYLNLSFSVCWKLKDEFSSNFGRIGQQTMEIDVLLLVKFKTKKTWSETWIIFFSLSLSRFLWVAIQTGISENIYILFFCLLPIHLNIQSKISPIPMKNAWYILAELIWTNSNNFNIVGWCMPWQLLWNFHRWNENEM